MTQKRNFFTIITLLVALVAFSVAIVAQETPETKKDGAERTKKQGRMGERGFRGGKDGKDHKMGFRRGRGGIVKGLSKLDLSEPQRSQIKTLIATHKNGQMPFYEEMRALKMKMRDGSASEGDKIRMQELHTSSKASAGELKNSILGVLTPDQLQKLEQMKADRQKMMDERRQRRMERKQKAPDSPVKTVG